MITCTNCNDGERYSKGLCQKCYDRKRYADKKAAGEARSPEKNNWLWTKYRLRESDYLALLDLQDGKCRGCQRHYSEFSKSFAVDHDHACCPGRGSCGKCVRGLLCFDCNIALGHVRDNLDVLMSLAAYVMETRDVLGQVTAP